MEHVLILLPVLVMFAAGLPFSGRQGDVNSVAEFSNKLGVDVYQKLAAEDGNIFLSPLGISTCLAMLFYGARGQTAEEMRNVLGYKEASLTDSQVENAFQSLLQALSKQTSKECDLYVANAVLTQKDYPVLPEYKDGLEEMYNASARDVDFVKEGQKVVQDINDWVKLKTNNQIKKFLNELDPTTIMVLLNAGYFKGTWKTEFDPKKTTDGVFFNNGLLSQNKTVQMMHLKEKLPYAKLGNLQVLELPYKGEDVSMFIALPDERNGLRLAKQELQPDVLRALKGRMSKTEVTVTLPKFKLEYKTTLNSALKELGMKKAFERSADFSGISEAGSIGVSNVIHKAVIVVNEEGSEASASTGVVVVGSFPGQSIPKFVADHPFSFAIVEIGSGMILFQGRVTEL